MKSSVKYLAALMTLGAAASAAAATWTEVLLPRDLDGDLANGPEAYYDTVQKLTWLADWSLAPRLDYQSALTWAQGQTFGGYTDWRLPTNQGNCQSYGPPPTVGCDDSELGKLYYDVLGYAPQQGGPGPFREVSGNPYWLDTSPLVNSRAWTFDALDGRKSLANVDLLTYSTVAVRTGDVAAIPEPSTGVLMVAGVALLVARRGRLG